MQIPFDNGRSDKYQIELFPDEAEHGDGIILNADRAGFLSLAEVFRQMADAPQKHMFIWVTRMMRHPGLPH